MKSRTTRPGRHCCSGIKTSRRRRQNSFLKNVLVERCCVLSRRVFVVIRYLPRYLIAVRVPLIRYYNIFNFLVVPHFSFLSAMMNNLFTSVFATSVLAFALLYYTRHEASCATAVTKCLTAQSCECDLINCACCQRCSTCLDPAYSECCSCMGE